MKYTFDKTGITQLKEMYRWYLLVKDRITPLTRRPAKLSGGGTATVTRVKIIEAPSDPNYDADPQSEEYNGRSWFTCRLVGETLTLWEALDPEAEPPEVFAESTVTVWPTLDSPSYIALAEISDPAEIILPPTELLGPTKWQKQENIRVSRVDGFQNVVNEEEPPVDVFDIRNCFPLPKVGEEVEIKYKTVGENSIPFIVSPSLQYGGLPAESSIRAGNDGFARAVYM